MNIEIKKLSSDDIGMFTELIHLFENIFEMQQFKMPPQKHLEALLQQDSFFVFAALQEEKVIGGLTAYVMQQYYAVAPLVYIYDLAVETKFQRRGIGRMLIENISDHCRQLGAEAIMVEAEQQDGHAIDFYRHTGAIGVNTVHFDYPLK